MATNPNNSIGTNAAFGGRTSVNAFNDSLAVYSGKGILSGFYISPNSGMTVSIGGSGLVRDVAVAEDNVGNRTTINNISGSPITVTIPEAPASDSRYDTIVAYVVANPTGSKIIADNYGVCGLIVVSGEASSAPVLATDAQIRSAITTDSGTSGEKAYYVELGEVLVASGTATITADMITQNTTSILSGEKIIDGTLNGSAITDGTINNDKIEDETIDTAKLADGIITKDKLASESVSAGNLLGFSTNNTTDSWVPVSHDDQLQHRVIKPFNNDGSIPESAMGLKNFIDYDTNVNVFVEPITIFTRYGSDTYKQLSMWNHQSNGYINFNVTRLNGIGLVLDDIDTSQYWYVHGAWTVTVPAASTPDTHYVSLNGLAPNTGLHSNIWGVWNGSGLAGEEISTTSAEGGEVFPNRKYGYCRSGHVMTDTANQDVTYACQYTFIKRQPVGNRPEWFFYYDVATFYTSSWNSMHCQGSCSAFSKNTIPTVFLSHETGSSGSVYSAEHLLTLEYAPNEDLTS